LIPGLNIDLHFPTSPIDLIVYFIGLIILWVIISVPVYFAGRFVTGGKSHFGNAMKATLGGFIAYFVVFFVVAFFLGAVVGDAARPFAVVLALLAWLWVYRASFDTSWVKAIAIVILAWIILIILDFIVVHLFGFTFPDFFPF
jgi:hypothetical protein